MGARKQEPQAIAKLRVYIQGFAFLLMGTAAMAQQTYMVNYAPDTATPPAGDTNLRTALESAVSGDTVNFSTSGSTNMNGQTTTLVDNISLNSLSVGPIILDTTGLTSGFAIDGSGQATPPYGITYSTPDTATLNITGSGSLIFQHSGFINLGTGTLNIEVPNSESPSLSFRTNSAFVNQADNGGIMNIILSGGNYSFPTGSGVFNNGSGIMNFIINEGTFDFPFLGGISSNSSSSMLTIINGGNFTFTGGSGFGSHGLGTMDISIAGGTFSSLNNEYPDFVNLSTGTMTIFFSGGNYSIVNGKGFVNANNGTMTTNIIGGTIAMDATGAACGATLNFSNTDTSTSIFHTGANGVIFGETAPNGVSLPGQLVFSPVDGGTPPTHQATIGWQSQPVQLVTMGGVGSTATLGGATLDLVSSTYRSVLPTTFTILAADSESSVIGTYGTTTSSSGLPSYTVTYDSVEGVTKTVTVTLNSSTTFTAATVNAGVTFNEIAMANYLDSLPSSFLQENSALGALNTLILAGNTAGYNEALTQIQPSQNRVAGTVAFNATTAVTDLTARQMMNGFETMGKSTSMATSLTTIDPKRLLAFNTLASQHLAAPTKVAHLLAPSSKKSFRKEGVGHLAFTNSPEEINRHPLMGRAQIGKANIWAQPYGQLVSQKATQDNPGLHSQMGGFVVGGDYEFARNALVGVLGGTSMTPFNWSQNRGWGQMKSGYGGLYAGWKHEEGFFIDGQTLFGGNTFYTNRTITYSTVNSTATGSHSAFQFTGNLELGYTLPVYDSLVIQPFIMGDYMVMTESGYTETGASGLNMTIKTKTSQFLQWDLGATLYKTFAMGETLLRPMLELGWVQRRPLGSNAGNVAGGLIGQTTTLVVAGTSKVYNQIAPGAGLMAQFANGFYVSGNIYGEVGGGLTIGEGLLRLGYEF